VLKVIVKLCKGGWCGKFNLESSTVLSPSVGEVSEVSPRSFSKSDYGIQNYEHSSREWVALI
jgi:hypothetical protein